MCAHFNNFYFKIKTRKSFLVLPALSYWWHMWFDHVLTVNPKQQKPKQKYYESGHGKWRTPCISMITCCQIRVGNNSLLFTILASGSNYTAMILFIFVKTSNIQDVEMENVIRKQRRSGPITLQRTERIEVWLCERFVNWAMWVMYIAVVEAALLQHLAINKLGMTGTCQCSDGTYSFKIIFPCISETKRDFLSEFFAKGRAQNFLTSDWKRLHFWVKLRYTDTFINMKHCHQKITLSIG